MKSAEGTDGLQKYYQVFLSAADTDNFWSGTSTLSSTPLSSVDYFGQNSSLSARFPAFSGYNVIDFGGQVERNDATQQIKVNISALSAAATGHFQFVITAPGGLVIFPAIQYGPNAKPDAPAYYIQSNSVPITPTPTQTYTATLTQTQTATQTRTPTWTRTPSQAKSQTCLLYTSPSPRDRQKSRMPSSA